MFFRNEVRVTSGQFILIQIRRINSHSLLALSPVSVMLLGGMLSTSDLTVPNGAGSSPVGE